MNQPFYRRRGATLLRAFPIIFLLFQTSTSVTAATSYLQELEAEAAATEETPTNPPPSSTQEWSEQPAAEGNAETIQSGLIKSEFEEALKSHFYGSYLFYSTLNDDKQQAVYEEYKKNNHIEHLRATIQSQMSN